MRRKETTEERHKRQKELLENQRAGKETGEKYIPKKNLKQEVCEKANKKGFICEIDSNGTVMFLNKDEEAVLLWLESDYGTKQQTHGNSVMRIPFSYGFCAKIRVESSINNGNIIPDSEGD